MPSIAGPYKAPPASGHYCRKAPYSPHILVKESYRAPTSATSLFTKKVTGHRAFPLSTETLKFHIFFHTGTISPLQHVWNRLQEKTGDRRRGDTGHTWWGGNSLASALTLVLSHERNWDAHEQEQGTLFPSFSGSFLPHREEGAVYSGGRSISLLSILARYTRCKES